MKGFDGDDNSDEDFGDNGDSDDGLLLPKVDRNILSMENGKTLCGGFKKFAWF